MSLLTNLTYICSDKVLIMNLIICAFMGLGSFFVAIRLCNIKDAYAKVLKYILAIVSTAFTSNFFLLLTGPEHFSSAPTTLLIIQISFGMVILWTIAYELSQLWLQRPLLDILSKIKF